VHLRCTLLCTGIRSTPSACCIHLCCTLICTGRAGGQCCIFSKAPQILRCLTFLAFRSRRSPRGCRMLYDIRAQREITSCQCTAWRCLVCVRARVGKRSSFRQVSGLDSFRDCSSWLWSTPSACCIHLCCTLICTGRAEGQWCRASFFEKLHRPFTL